MSVMACSWSTAQGIREQKTVLLNYKNYVYLIFDRNVSEIKFDCESEDIQLEQLTANSFGLRFSEHYTVPAEGIGGMVVLSGNIFHPLWLYYSDTISPAGINMSMGSETAVATAGDTLPATTLRAEDTERYCNNLLSSKRSILSVGEKNGKFELQLHSIGVTATHIYFLLSAQNNSKVDYTVGYHGMHLRHRTAAAGAEEILPLYHACNDPGTVAAGQQINYVLVYDLFTTKNKQEIIYTLKELNGGRSISLPIKSHHLYSNIYRL